MNLVGLTVVVAHVGVVLELVGGFAHQLLNLRGEDGVLVAAGDHHKDAGAEHVVEVVYDEVGLQAVHAGGNGLGFDGELLADGLLVDAVEQHLALPVAQFHHLVVHLVVLLQKVIQQLVERCAAHALLHVVYTHADVALLHHEGHDALLVHVEAGHQGGVEEAGKLELAVHHFARVDAL